MSNANLNRAARAKADEFYTQLSDIERELERDEYRAFFSGKVVYCNCDDFRHSQFVRYFTDNFAALNLEKFVATGMNAGYLIKTAGGVETGALTGNGDFRSDECVEILREADVVVTNPPFSLFREYVAQLMKYQKKFVIVGHMNAITYKEIFPLIQQNKITLGYGFKGMYAFFKSHYEDFAAASEHRDGMIRNSGVTWYTNIPLKKYREELLLTFEYSPELYPKYDNYDAIEVSKTARIPMDYDGVMGVPITFLDKYNPDQFEIVWRLNEGGFLGSRRTYKRLLIRRRQ